MTGDQEGKKKKSSSGNTEGIGLAKKFVRLVNTLFNTAPGENEKCLIFS